LERNIRSSITHFQKSWLIPNRSWITPSSTKTKTQSDSKSWTSAKTKQRTSRKT
jgi:hypothetical protein